MMVYSNGPWNWLSSSVRVVTGYLSGFVGRKMGCFIRRPRSQIASSCSGTWTGPAIGEALYQMYFVIPYVRDFGGLDRLAVLKGLRFLNLSN